MVSSPAVLALTVTCAFLFGLLVVMLSSMRGQLARQLHLSEARSDGLWAVMNLFLVPFTFVAGVLIDVGDVRWTIALGSLLIALSLLLLLSARGYRQAFFAWVLAACGGACIACSAIFLMPRAFFGSNEASASLNMGNVFFALGALIAPALADVLLRGLGFRPSLMALALICLGPGILALCIESADVPPSHSPELFSLLGDPILWVAAGIFFLYAPLEGCVHNWAEGFLRGMGHREQDVPRLVAGFWSCFLVGRLLTAFLLHRRWLPQGQERWMVCIMALGAAVWLGNLLGTVRRSKATLGFLFLGLFLGPIFPTLIGYLFSQYQTGLGTVFGLLFAIGSAGSLIFAPMISSRISRTSAQKALVIPLFLCLLLMVLTLIFALWPVDPPG